MTTFGRDVRWALGAARRAPAFAATVVATLALGIGAATAVFATVHGVLRRPLPYAAPERLVRLWEEHPGGVSPGGNRWLSRSTYAAWIERTQTLDAVGGYTLVDVQVVFGRDAVKEFAARVSPAVMATLGVAPALGRWLTEEDGREGAAPVAILGDRLWHERYAARRDVLGTPLLVDGQMHTIVGVAPRGFAFPDPRARLWLPYAIPLAVTAPGVPAFTALGRLKAGVTPAQAEVEGTAAARAAPAHRLTEFFFGRGGAPIVHARVLAEDMTASTRPALAVLGVAVVLVLLIASANVTSLFLSRGVTRQRELAIRAAIGGSRTRIARQLLTECAVVSCAGSVLGLALAWWLIGLLPAIAPSTLPRLDAVALDGTVLTFWAGTTVLTTLVAGLAPAVSGAAVDLCAGLRAADRSSNLGFGGKQARRLRDGLLIAEAAFAVVVIVAASLLARSFVRLVQVDNGYTADGVLVARVELPRGATDARADQFIEIALPRLRAMPGVTEAGAGAMIPLMSRTAVAPFTLPAHASGEKPSQGRALVYWVTPGYAEALGLRLREGRFFTEADVRAGTLATIVNEEFVRQHLSVPRVSGLLIPNLVGQDGAIAEIVGVVGTVLKDGNDRDPQPELYFVHGSHGRRIGDGVSFVMRTAGQPARLATDVRAAVRQIDREAVVDRIEPLATAVSASLDAPRFAAEVVAGFAGVAMLLAAVGLYGALTYSVSQRVRELGIRAALGARRTDLVRLVLREGLSVTVAGVALGVLGAIMSTRLMQDVLFGIGPRDPVTFVAAPAVLVIASLAASLGPALRAAATDPAITLRRG